MIYNKLGKSDISVSKLSFGAWGIGGGCVWTDKSLNPKSVARLLDSAREQGINYIDTAPVYGTGISEELLGEALSEGRRKDFVLQTKCSLNWRDEGGNFHYERDGVTVRNDTRPLAIRKDVEDSLKRLRTDYLDVLIVHYVCKDFDVSETMEELVRLKHEGKIRAIGLSNSSPADLREYSSYGEIDLVQEQFSLLANYHGESYFDEARKQGVCFQSYGALEEGFLTSPSYLERSFPATDIRARLPWGKEPYKSRLKELFAVLDGLREKYSCSYANLALAWTLAQYENLNLLTGFTREETIKDSVKALDLKLSKEDLALIDEASIPARVKVLDK